jgi:hypothetical protein
MINNKKAKIGLICFAVMLALNIQLWWHLSRRMKHNGSFFEIS